MVLDEDGSLKIRNVLIDDSGNYDCGGNTSTILNIKERNNEEKDMETSLNLISNANEETDHESKANEFTPLVGKYKVEAIGNKSWLIIVVILVVLLVIIVFIMVVMYKDRQSSTQSTPRFSPNMNGGESQCALKDCMEVDEDMTFIGT